MTTKVLIWAVGLGAAVALAGSATAMKASQSKSSAGWYMEHAGQGTFQFCGQSQQLRVLGMTGLRARAKKFGLEPDTPVYVRLIGRPSATGKEFKVLRIKQFGSPTPVRDCPMTGVVIAAPASATK